MWIYLEGFSRPLSGRASTIRPGHKDPVRPYPHEVCSWKGGTRASLGRERSFAKDLGHRCSTEYVNDRLPRVTISFSPQTQMLEDLMSSRWERPCERMICYAFSLLKADASLARRSCCFEGSFIGPPTASCRVSTPSFGRFCSLYKLRNDARRKLVSTSCSLPV